MREAQPQSPPSRAACFLVDLPEQTSQEDARAHVVELWEQIGPGAQIDVRWPGESTPDLPDGIRAVTGATGARMLAAAAARASRAARHLVVLLGPILPDASAIQALLSAFDLDPLIGFAQPRFADASGESVWLLPDPEAVDGFSMPRARLSSVPDHYITTERLSACLAIRREVAAWFVTSPDAPDELAASLSAELCQARRRGYRNAVMNRVVVESPFPPAMLYPVPDETSRKAIEDRFPDVRTATEWFRGAETQKFERLAAMTGRSPRTRRTSVLFDCRGAQSHHNGTSQAILGLLDGVKSEMPHWEIDLLCEAPGAQFHDIAHRYATMQVITELRDRKYAAAVRLDQPWALSTIAELHRSSTAIAFNLLDTIAWDVVYVATPELEKTWRFVGEHSDGLLYNSAFTRERFKFRFPVASQVIETVTQHSLNPAEYRDESAAVLPQDDHILVFGNHYDHKAVNLTVEVLSRAFPYERIHAIGVERREPHERVFTAPSGKLPDAEIERLVASARLVVFPSFYEGFGLPVMKALAYSRTVVVRASPLWRELAGSTRMPGRLVEFVAPHDLVEVVGKALRGEPIQVLPLGGHVSGEAPMRWRDCARRMIGLVDRIAVGDARRWCARERALTMAGL